MIETEKFVKIDENNYVTFIHYMPFDQINGLGKTREELLAEGYLTTKDHDNGNPPDERYCSFLKYFPEKDEFSLEFDVMKYPTPEAMQKTLSETQLMLTDLELSVYSSSPVLFSKKSAKSRNIESVYTHRYLNDGCTHEQLLALTELGILSQETVEKIVQIKKNRDLRYM